MEIEEEGMVNGFIPEESRARHVASKIDMDMKEARVCCEISIQGTGLREMRRRKAVIRW